MSNHAGVGVNHGAVLIAVLVTLMAGGLAACGGSGSTDGKKPPSAKSYEERNADYIDDLPPLGVEERQLINIGYKICDSLKAGQSENSVLNDLEETDSADGDYQYQLSGYYQEIMDAAKANLCAE